MLSDGGFYVIAPPRTCAYANVIEGLIGAVPTCTMTWVTMTAKRRSRSWKITALFILVGASLHPATRFTVRNSNAAYGIDFWHEADGFAQSRVRAIVQTRDGYVWLGTDGGLVRFNGETFTAFTTQTGALKDNEIWALQEDTGGGLWIGTYGGGLTYLKDGQFRTYTAADGLPDDVIMSLAMDSQGGLSIITPQGLAQRSPQGDFLRVPSEVASIETRATAVCSSSAQGTLAATHNGVFRVTEGRLERLPWTSARVGSPSHLICSSDGSVWIGYSNGAIEHRVRDAAAILESPPEAGRALTRLYQDPHGGIWAVRGRRITRFANGRFEIVPVEGGDAGLGNIYSLCMDREDGVWVGLQSNGLARLRTRQVTTLSVEDGLPDERTRAIFEDRRGDLWIGTAEGLARDHEGRFTTWTERDGIRLGDVRSVTELSNGAIWISAGRDLLSVQHDRLVPVPGWSGVVEIEVIYRDGSGHIWIGTDGSGLFEYSNGRFQRYTVQEGLASNHIRAILEARDGALWISTFGGGLSKFRDGKFTHISTREGLAGDRVLAIHEDEQGALWFATRRGLSRFKDGAFFTWTGAGLLTDFVYSILDDNRGNFWFSSAQGIFRVSKQELRDFAAGKLKRITSVSYSKKDGLRTRAGNLGNQPVAIRTSAGQLLFTSMKGLVAIDPDRLVANASVPPVYIEKVILNRKEQPVDGHAQLPLGAGELEIHYAALGFSAPEKMRYRYMLEGFDHDWIDAGSRRFTYYANLSPGKYRFRVMAASADGAWNDSGSSFAFAFTPPFYRTPVFGGLIISCTLLVAWLAYRLRMQGLRARYSAVLAERNRISRDIHDTLSQNLAGIALQLDAVHMQLPDVKSDLKERLDEACNLTRYSLAEARRAIADLRSDTLECPELAVALPEIAGRIASPPQARVQVSGEPVKLSPAVERNLLRIFQEALANVVKHAHARCVDIELRYEARSVKLRVHDDGHGFDPESLNPAGSGHYGLIGMRERVERIGGHLTLHSKPGEGTDVSVEVPI